MASAITMTGMELGTASPLLVHERTGTFMRRQLIEHFELSGVNEINNPPPLFLSIPEYR
jgi:hypothetical protein